MASASLGSLVIELAANTARLTSDLGRAATIAEKQARRMTRMFRGAAGLVGGFSLVLLGKKFFDNMNEAQRASGQLAAALKSTGGAAGLTVGQLDNLAKSLQKTTTFSDEAVKGVESVLLAFTNLHGEQFKSATAAVTDLSTRLGIDLTSAAKLVGKALNDPVNGLGALRKAGVSFTKSEEAVIKALVKTGDIAGAQDKILAALTTRFGGAAAAARNTLGGAITGLKNAFGDLFEGTDKQTTAVTKALNQFADLLGDPKFKANIDASIGFLIASLAEAIKMINGTIDGWRLLDQIVGDSQRSMFNVDGPREALLKAQNALGAQLNQAEEDLAARQARGAGLGLDIAERRVKELRAQIKVIQADLAKTTVAPFEGPVAAHGRPTGPGVSQFTKVVLDQAAAETRLQEIVDSLRSSQEKQNATLAEQSAWLKDLIGKFPELAAEGQKALAKIADIQSLEARNKAWDDYIAKLISAREAEKEVAQAAADFNDEIAHSFDNVGSLISDLESADTGIAKAFSDGQSVIEATRTESEKYAVTLERLNELLAAGAIDFDTYQRAVLQAQDQLDSMAKTLKEGLHNAFEDMINTGKFNTRSLVQFMIAELSKKALFNAIDKVVDAIAKIFKKPSGSSGFFGSLLSGIGTLLGGGGGGSGGAGIGNVADLRFAKGGSFTVGGKGGTDTNVVAFRATKGERVVVTPPGKKSRNGDVSKLIQRLPGFANGADFLVGEEPIVQRATRAAAKGADFKVGGRSGVDTNVVAFRATRGERVVVTPAGKKRKNTSFEKLLEDLPGFARGADFTVGGVKDKESTRDKIATISKSGTDFTVTGRSGVDTNVVAFRATKGERVVVTPPGQKRRSHLLDDLPGFAKGGSFTVGDIKGMEDPWRASRASRGDPHVTKSGQANSAPVINYAPIYHIAPGVTRQELLPLLRQTHQQSISDMSELIRRGRFA